MRSVLRKAIWGLFIVAGITSMARQASAQSYFELGLYPGGTNACAGVAGGNMTNGTDFVTWPCNAYPGNGFTGAKDQAFSIDTSDYIEAGGFFYYSLRNGDNYQKCMSVSGGSKNNNASVMIWDCLGTSHPDQYWLLFPDESTGCDIVYNYNSGMALGVGTNGYLVQKSTGYEEFCPHAVSP